MLKLASIGEMKTPEISYMTIHSTIEHDHIHYAPFTVLTVTNNKKKEMQEAHMLYG